MARITQDMLSRIVGDPCTDVAHDRLVGCGAVEEVPPAELAAMWPDNEATAIDAGFDLCRACFVPRRAHARVSAAWAGEEVRQVLDRTIATDGAGADGWGSRAVVDSGDGRAA